MLIELHSPAFMQNGETRPPVVFGTGLNVVLGTTTRNNSIGKSTFMLAIDFAFGGNSYKNDDLIANTGHHEIRFKFKFDRV